MPFVFFLTPVNKYGPVSAGKHRKSLANGSSIPAGILLSVSGFSGIFLQDPATFPHLS
jgi:hypothetical protein